MKQSVTPPPAPISLTPVDGIPRAMPTSIPTERISRPPSKRFSTLPVATDRILISKNVLVGLCLTAFAFGTLTTLAVDRLHARATDPAEPHDPNAVVLKPTRLPDPPR
ncbi:MAG TPA: hypothetical protein VHO06_14950, partial [Polyangia bacterium]|nr:hypothetical protein [Polyangia bacterium]